MKKYIVVLVGVLMLPAFVHAQVTDKEAQISSLRSQIAELQSQLNVLLSGVSSSNFNRDLTVGSTGSDVTSLQRFLISKGYGIPAGATGYYGVQTQAAVSAYQSANQITVTGNFDSATRTVVNGDGVATGGDSDTPDPVTQTPVHTVVTTTPTIAPTTTPKLNIKVGADVDDRGRKTATFTTDSAYDYGLIKVWDGNNALRLSSGLSTRQPQTVDYYPGNYTWEYTTWVGGHSTMSGDGWDGGTKTIQTGTFEVPN